jgi:hypothetical protein
LRIVRKKFGKERVRQRLLRILFKRSPNSVSYGIAFSVIISIASAEPSTYNELLDELVQVAAVLAENSRESNACLPCALALHVASPFSGSLFFFTWLVVITAAAALVFALKTYKIRKPRTSTFSFPTL